MVIEIRGAAFINKGAELMLRAIVEKLKQKMPEGKLVMEPHKGSAPYLRRAELGLYQKMWLHHYGIQWGYLGALIPKKLRQMYGMVLDSEVDVVLDASGFAYSDQWGPEYTIMTEKVIRKWKKQGTKVVFMPQAFGPFTGEKIKKAFKTVVEYADLVFARDEVSYNHIITLVKEQRKIRIAPDFTNLIKGEVPNNFDGNENRFCIIPNYRMMDKTSMENSKSYIPFLISCVEHLQKKEAKPFILIHEGDDDLWLGKEVAKGCGHPINIVRETNALKIKGIIGASNGVISSRFHGLVSALSQGVPALATGWSHKYEMLFKDYGFPEGMMAVNTNSKEIQDKINILISGDRSRQIKKKITQIAKIQERASFKMWDEVFKKLG